MKKLLINFYNKIIGNGWLLHFLLAYVLYDVLYYFLIMEVAFSLTFILIFVKEFLDKQKTFFSYSDIIVSVVGLMLAYILN